MLNAQGFVLGILYNKYIIELAMGLINVGLSSACLQHHQENVAGNLMNQTVT